MCQCRCLVAETDDASHALHASEQCLEHVEVGAAFELGVQRVHVELPGSESLQNTLGERLRPTGDAAIQLVEGRQRGRDFGDPEHTAVRGGAVGIRPTRVAPVGEAGRIDRGQALRRAAPAGRREATGRGIMIMCDEAVKKLGLARESSRVIVQGFGNVGSNAARLMADAGYQVIGIIEVEGGLYNAHGIDVDALWEYRQRNRSISGFKDAEAVDPAELMVTDCEILIPAATENQITSRNADRIKCRILAEGANGPTTAAADEILAEKKVFVIPDILCNAGGVTTSYFEWVQDRQGYFWKESVVIEQLEHIMKTAFEDVVRYAETHGVNNRIASYMLAIDRVAYTIRQRGIYA